ncbi:hypothetical protein GCM10022200_21200 [Microbacterium awajiense]|uniref:Uncharacterized protein n=1 Tax=Microbacterium awajiense TaxID=415214 RepID=A0ABP7APN5_9MICO
MSTAQRWAPTFDARALVQPVDRSAVAEHTRRMRAEGRLPSTPTNIVAIIVFVMVGGFILTTAIPVFFGVFGALAAVLSAEGGAFAGIVIVLVVMFGLLVFAGVVVAIVVAFLRLMSGSHAKWYRLDHFARANAMTYLPAIGAPPLPGMIFGLGGSRQASDVVRGDRPRFVEFANYRYTTGSGRNRTVHKWGYVAVKLDVPLPHIVLDAVGNNTLFGSNLPASFDKDQRLSLEGDFDRFFSLYCPAGYERDALYLFTPDIMARFIDNAAALDVEIVDDWLFLYAKRDFSTLDPAMWAWLFTVVAALLDKLAQWERWRDDRLAQAAAAPTTTDAASAAPPAWSATVPFDAPTDRLRPPPGVAAGGQRLRRRIPWVAIAVIGGFVAFWLFIQFGGFAFFAALLR